MTTLSTGIEVATLAAVPGLGDPVGFYMVRVSVFNTLPVMFNTIEV